MKNHGKYGMKGRFTTSGCIILILTILLLAIACTAPCQAVNGSIGFPSYIVKPSMLARFNYMSAEMTVNPASASVGQQIAVVVVAKYPNGTAANGATIKLSSTPAGTFGKSSTTGSVLSTTFTANSPGNYSIEAYVNKDGFLDGSNTTYIFLAAANTPTVAPVSPTPAAHNNTTVAGNTDLSGIMPLLPYIIAALVLLLIVLLAVAYLWFKRDLRLEPKKSSVPCDGKSTIPVRVSFVNGFGSPRRAKTDTEVALEATAGTIQNVILQNGRDFIDATLTASKEFGPVTVTGRVNNKTAQAKVSFTYAQAALDLSASPAEIPADGSSTSTVTVRVKDGNGNYIAPLEDLAIELRSSIGKVPSSVRMPAKAPEVPAAFTASSQSGTAIITAVAGSLKGETKVALKGTPQKFCMLCGVAMGIDASVCPKCGQTAPSGMDTKPCSTCGTVLPGPAKFCYSCGARQPETATPAAGDPAATKK